MSFLLFFFTLLYKDFSRKINSHSQMLGVIQSVLGFSFKVKMLLQLEIFLLSGLLCYWFSSQSRISNIGIFLDGNYSLLYANKLLYPQGLILT